MPIERIEDRLQKTMCHQHAWSCNIDDRDAFLRSNRLERIAAGRSSCADASSFATRVARIQNVDGNVLLDCGQKRRGMQNLGAEIGQLRRFIKTDNADSPRIRT